MTPPGLRHGSRPSRRWPRQSCRRLTVLRPRASWSTCSPLRPARRWPGSAASAIRAGPPHAKSLRNAMPTPSRWGKRLAVVQNGIIRGNHRQLREQLQPGVVFPAPRNRYGSHILPDRPALGELDPPVETATPPVCCERCSTFFKPPPAWGAYRPGCGSWADALVSCWWQRRSGHRC